MPYSTSRGAVVKTTVLLAICTTAVAVVIAACGGGAAGPVLTPLEQQGRDVVESLHCATCHTTNGSRALGPTWKGLAGSSVTLNDGSVVAADAAYLHRSILDPNAQTVLGYPPALMSSEVEPGSIGSEDADAIVAYLQTLK